MNWGIFETKAGSGYDDEVADRYHFSRQYLSVANALVGGWVVYREPYAGGGRGGFVATAQINT